MSVIMNYIPTTKKDREDMLRQIGVKSINDLTVDFKPLFNEELDLSDPMSELELGAHMTNLSLRNKIMKYFIGAGYLQPLYPVCSKPFVTEGRIPYRLYAISGRNESGNPACYVRIPIVHMPAYRHGCGQCFHV